LSARRQYETINCIYSLLLWIHTHSQTSIPEPDKIATEGIRLGKDEVLEKAVEILRGK
jgi:hypothetical protein